MINKKSSAISSIDDLLGNDPISMAADDKTKSTEQTKTEDSDPDIAPTKPPISIKEEKKKIKIGSTTNLTAGSSTPSKEKNKHSEITDMEAVLDELDSKPSYPSSPKKEKKEKEVEYDSAQEKDDNDSKSDDGSDDPSQTDSNMYEAPKHKEGSKSSKPFSLFSV